MPPSSLSALQCADFSTTLLSVIAQLLVLSKKACPVFAQAPRNSMSNEAFFAALF
jgi:hypothetical protein